MEKNLHVDVIQSSYDESSDFNEIITLPLFKSELLFPSVTILLHDIKIKVKHKYANNLINLFFIHPP